MCNYSPYMLHVTFLSFSISACILLPRVPVPLVSIHLPCYYPYDTVSIYWY